MVAKSVGWKRVAVGQTDSLGQLYRAHASDALRLAYLLTRNRQTAEDITQEAFVRIGRKVIGFRDGDHARAYLFRTVINEARGRARRVKLERAAMARLGRPDVQQWPDLVQRGDPWQALLALPARQRAALFLRFYLDQSETTAADVLGCSTSALKSLVSRGLKTLRTSMGGPTDE